MQPYKKYQQVNISTADPLRIVIMLYEGAIKNLNQALRRLEDNPKEAGERIGRTMDILNYLRNSLNHEKGGEISVNLERLYEYMRDILNEANIHRDHTKVREAIALLQTLLEGWRGLLSGQTTEHESTAQAQIHTPVSGDLPTGGLSMVG
jgi:flagellar protein FliS